MARLEVMDVGSPSRARRGRNRRLRFSGCSMGEAGFETSSSKRDENTAAISQTDFDAFARDVAARVIQHYYRERLAERRRLRDIQIIDNDDNTGGDGGELRGRATYEFLPTLKADVKTFASSGGSSASGRYMDVAESIDHERVFESSLGSDMHEGRTEDADPRPGQNKLQSIIAFLDEVEDSTDQQRQRQNGSSSPSSANTPTRRGALASHRAGKDVKDTDVNGGDGMRDNSVGVGADVVLKENNGRGSAVHVRQSTSEAAGTSRRESLVRGVKSKMEALKADLETARTRITALERDRELLTGAAATQREEMEREAATRMDALKVENEAAIRRHLDFIDRLLADKDELSRALAQSATESKAIETRNEEKLKALQRDWSRELATQRDAWQRGEKARRDEWARSKTKEIKEMTVRGLEPEIQRLMQRHRSDVADLEARHHAAMKQRQDEASLQHESYIRALRERMLHERQDELEAERMKGAARMREMSDAHDAALARQRSAFAEKDHERTESHERAVRLLCEGHTEEIEKMRIGYKSRLTKKETEARDMAEAVEAEMRKTLDMERASLEEKLAARMQAQLAEAEKALVAEYTAKATEEVAAVVAQLEEDSMGTKLNFDKRIAQKEADLSRKYEHMLLAATEKERRLQERYDACRSELVSSEGRCGETTLRIAEYERQLDDSRRRCEEAERSAEDADDASASLRSQLDAMQAMLAEREASDSGFAREAELRIESLSSEVARLRAVGEAHEARHRLDMEEVDSRVRKLVAQKDDVIAKLQAQLEELETSLDE